MRPAVRQFAVAALIAAIAWPAFARVPAPLPSATPASEGFSATHLRRLGREVGQRVDGGTWPGAVTLVARRGRIVHWQAHGWLGLGRGPRMRRDSIFRVYSMTKTAASVAVLMLAEAGALALDDEVARFLPEFGGLSVLTGGTADAPRLRAPRRSLTIRHLLIHAPGFATAPGDGASAELLARAGLDAATGFDDYCARLASVPLAADPGSRFAYDGAQFVVLSRLVEVVSGMPFDRFLHERLFAPLAMQDTGFTVPPAERHRIAEMTTSDAEGRLIPSPQYANRPAGEMINPYPSGAGGLYSTAGDWLRFSQMLLNGGELEGRRILSPASVEQMWTNQLPRLDPPAVEFRPGAGFGIGGHVVTDPVRLERRGSSGEFGWNGAAATWFMIDRERRIVALILMQHLPQGLSRDPPRAGPLFYNLVHQSLTGPHRR
ncbi:MAG: serine hydrolase domain-containing protein [Gammaproteobacteria bacterium]